MEECWREDHSTRLVNRRRTGREAGWVRVATSCWRAVRGARGEGRAREQARAAVSQARESIVPSQSLPFRGESCFPGSSTLVAAL